MIKVVKDEREAQLCMDYLNREGSNCLRYTHLFYTERGGKITACAGWNKETGSQIEPLVANTNIDAYKLFYFMQGLVTGQGFNYIRVITQNEKAIEIIKRDGFTLWNKQINEYIKEI